MNDTNICGPGPGHVLLMNRQHDANMSLPDMIEIQHDNYNVEDAKRVFHEVDALLMEQELFTEASNLRVFAVNLISLIEHLPAENERLKRIEKAAIEWIRLQDTIFPEPLNLAEADRELRRAIGQDVDW